MPTKLLTHGSATHRRARKYKEEFLRRFFGGPKRQRLRRSRRWPSISAWETKGSNIVGIGFGTKEVKGAGVGSGPALRIYVRRKLPKGKVRAADRIPETINGLATDVIEVGTFKSAARPAEGGAAGHNPNSRCGTLGCLVRGNSAVNRYILSCFHVLGQINSPVELDSVVEPCGGSKIAELWSWMNFQPAGNVVDCAIARLMNPTDFLPNLHGIGRQNPSPMDAFEHQSVKKSGGNPPYVTLGVVSDVSADFPVNYPQGTFGFVNQILVRGVGGAFGFGGDSGALVVDAATLRAVGLLFAVDDSLGLVNPIHAVLNSLEVKIV
jgi:hypothetical protein